MLIKITVINNETIGVIKTNQTHIIVNSYNDLERLKTLFLSNTIPDKLIIKIEQVENI